MTTAIVYQDRDNSFTLTLEKNEVNLTEGEMEAITKFEIKYKKVYYNSVDTPLGFVVDNEEATVVVKPYILGLLASRLEDVELIVYDIGEYTHGLVWDTFPLQVQDTAIPTPEE